MVTQRIGIKQAIVHFVVGFVKENGYSPTYEEIRKSVGLSSKSHVGYYLTLLEREGVIERTPRTPRSLRLVASPSSAPKPDTDPGQRRHWARTRDRGSGRIFEAYKGETHDRHNGSSPTEAGGRT
jgi:SOS-response transcriptional repressor LexA